MAMFLTMIVCALTLALQPGCSSSREGSEPTTLAADSAAAKKAEPAPAKEMQESCGMGNGGGCCGACQQAQPKAPEPAAGGGCPCQKARKAAQGS